MEMAQICLIQIFQIRCNVHIAVEIDIRIFRAVVFGMESHKSLLRQLRNGFRQPTGLKSIWRIREKGFESLVFFNGIGRGINALHFIVHHAVIHQGFILPLPKLVMPSLLAQGIRIFRNQRIKYRIQIYIYQIFEIFVVAACHRIHSFVRVGHGIEKGV